MSSTTTTSNTTGKQGGSGSARPQRRAPQRTCVGCRRTGDQASFVRLVRNADGVTIDEGRRRTPGRGAYLCRDAVCWERALKGPLARALRTTISQQDREALAEAGARFAGSNTESTNAESGGSDDPPAPHDTASPGRSAQEKERDI